MAPTRCWITALALLLSDVTRASLVPRQDYSCGDPTSNITSDNGLNFIVHPCTKNSIGTGLWFRYDQGDNITACINHCAEDNIGPQGPCVAVVYGITDHVCYIVNSTLNSTEQLTGTGYVYGTHTALVANFSQFQNLDTSCAYLNGTTHSTNNGLNFKIWCNSDVTKQDLTPGLTPNGVAIQARAHKDSLRDCMQYCSTMRPKCYGVTFVPGMVNGYWNCYPKTSGANIGTIIPSDTTHFALAQFDSPDTTCTPGCNNASASSSSNGNDRDTYNVACNYGANGTILSSVYTQDMTDCISACDNYTDTQCLAVSYFPNGDAGYENCLLMSNVQSNYSLTDSQFAQRLNTTSGDTSVCNTKASSTSKAWVAGPVIGALAAIAILVFAIWWCRKRRSPRSRNDSRHSKDLRWRRDQSELDANFTERKELETRQPLAELDGSGRR